MRRVEVEYNPELVRAWKAFIAPFDMNPEEELPLWNAFKAGWEARLKYDLSCEKAHGKVQGY